ncbi:MAG: HAMP domain-containing histidine kinase [Planctomycetes bacterium]|nr:HAMP domain-containing histidine kinase [Planctomycetota bacterium]
MLPRHRISWRIGLPFVLLVLAAGGLLAVWFTTQRTADRHRELLALARRNAEFVPRAGLPTSDKMAEDLEAVLGHGVHFRVDGVLVRKVAEPLASALLAVPADGQVHTLADGEVTAARIDPRRELLLVQTPPSGDPRLLPALLVVGALALLLAWSVGRSLVRPLQRLAGQLPRIDDAGPLLVPGVERADEIGDLARAFAATRTALAAERQQRLQAERLAVLGRMTAALAHEVQNPVAAISMHAQLLRGGPADAVARLLEREAEALADLVHQWLFLCRPEPPACTPTELGGLLDELCAGMAPQFAHAAVQVLVQRAGDLTLAVDRRRLRQVLHNLLRNAVQAMPTGGRVDVTARGTAGAVTITIADQGPGFSAAALQRYGEFFFSEKEGGMGIGLAVAREILRAHGGSLAVANQPAGGALVTVTLPRPTAMPPSPPPRPLPEPLQSHTP